jgi:UDP-N-acetylglucosamine 1-carboxyvinyltransferase
MTKDAFEITGGCCLRGAIVPQGAKNEALQVLCATLLTEEEITLSNIPDIRDVRRLRELLEGLGVDIRRQAADTYTFSAREIDLDYIHSKEFRRRARSIRGSVMLIGPLLARFRRAFLPKPGGDKIGRRRLDTHFAGLQPNSNSIPTPMSTTSKHPSCKGLIS